MPEEIITEGTMDKASEYQEIIRPNAGASSREIEITEPPVAEDNLTPKGRGSVYFTCDGREVGSLDEVFEYNQMYYEMTRSAERDDLSGKGMIK